MNEKLLQSYRDAIYVIDINGKKHEFQVGKTYQFFNTLLAAKKASHAVFLTAFNPASVCCPIDINLKNNKRLSEDLVNGGYRFLKGYGGDRDSRWRKEESLLVFDLDRGNADRFALKYRQNAYLWIEFNFEIKLCCLKQS